MNRSLQLTIAAFLSTMFMWMLFLASPNLSPVLKDPSHTYFSTYGDGWKNLYTVAYHAIYDEGLFETQAFNYPDGEHIAFADGQPLLSTLLQALPIEEPTTVIAVVQLLPFVSCILGAILLSWLLLRLRLPLALAILFGIGIALLSPQMTRVAGHYGLSYVFAIPLLFHLLLSWTKHRSWKWISLLTLSIVLLGQIHLYYLAIGLLVSVVFMAFLGLYQRFGSGLHVLFQIVFLVCVSYLSSKLLIELPWDVIDRPAAPYGLKAYVSNWEDMLFDRELPWWAWVNENIAKLRKIGDFEGRGYLGIFTGLFFVYLLIRYILVNPVRKVVGKPVKPIFSDVPEEVNATYLLALLCTGLVAGFIALGYFLYIPGAESVLDSFGPLRQFRSLGRFVWIFYISLQICFTAWLFFFTKNVSSSRFTFSSNSLNRWFSIVFSVLPYLVGIVTIAEGSRAISSIATHPSSLPTELIELSEFKLDKRTYQAVLPLPFFHVGSENYPMPVVQGQILPSTLMSLKTGLPNMGVMMSRQSISLSKERLGFNSAWKSIPAVFGKVDPNKSILIVVDKKQLDEKYLSDLSSSLQPWLSLTDTLYQSESSLLLSFLPSAMNLNKVSESYCSYWKRNSVDTSQLAGRVYLNSLANLDWHLADSLSGQSFSGEDYQLIHRWKRPQRKNGSTENLNVSWSAFVGIDGHATHKYKLQVVDSKTEVLQVAGKISPINHVDSYDGDWARLSIQVPATMPGDELELWGKPTRHPKAKSIYLRNLVASPAGINTKWHSQGAVIVDGIRLQTCK